MVAPSAALHQRLDCHIGRHSGVRECSVHAPSSAVLLSPRYVGEGQATLGSARSTDLVHPAQSGAPWVRTVPWSETRWRRCAAGDFSGSWSGWPSP